jgi:glutamine transport system permease protein
MVDWELLWESIPYLAWGALATLYITVLATVVSVVFGMVLAAMRLSRFRVLKFVAIAYIDFMRGVPLLVVLFIAYFGLPAIGLNLSPFTAAILGMGFCGAAYTAEIFRSGIMSIGKGQTEAAHSLGLTYTQTMRYVVLPQALRISMPPLTNEFITLLKDSSLVSVIGMEELVRRGQYVVSRTFDPFTVFMLVAIFYLVLTYASSFLLGRLERALTYD